MTLAVLACAALVCAGSLVALNHTVDAARRLQGLAAQAAGAGDMDRAGALLGQLEDFWRGRAVLMELLASHDALHDVGGAIAEAAICLDCDDRDDFLCAMSRLAMGLEHLKDEEAVRWENVY